jgi:hypothetical protein
MAMSDDASPVVSPGPDNVEEVQRRLAEIQRRKRGRIRWSIGRHTAELAIEALGVDRQITSKRNGKQRRRKRHKRLL